MTCGIASRTRRAALKQILAFIQFSSPCDCPNPRCSNNKTSILGGSLWRETCRRLQSETPIVIHTQRRTMMPASASSFPLCRTSDQELRREIGFRQIGQRDSDEMARGGEPNFAGSRIALATQRQLRRRTEFRRHRQCDGRGTGASSVTRSERINSRTVGNAELHGTAEITIDRQRARGEIVNRDVAVESVLPCRYLKREHRYHLGRHVDGGAGFDAVRHRSAVDCVEALAQYLIALQACARFVCQLILHRFKCPWIGHWHADHLAGREVNPLHSVSIGAPLELAFRRRDRSA